MIAVEVDVDSDATLLFVALRPVDNELMPVDGSDATFGAVDVDSVLIALFVALSWLPLIASVLLAEIRPAATFVIWRSWRCADAHHADRRAACEKWARDAADRGARRRIRGARDRVRAECDRVGDVGLCVRAEGECVGGGCLRSRATCAPVALAVAWLPSAIVLSAVAFELPRASALAPLAVFALPSATAPLPVAVSFRTHRHRAGTRCDARVADRDRAVAGCRVAGAD